MLRSALSTGGPTFVCAGKVLHSQPANARTCAQVQKHVNVQIRTHPHSTRSQTSSLRAPSNSLRTQTTQAAACNETYCFRIRTPTTLYSKRIPLIEGVCTSQQKRHFRTSNYLFRRKVRHPTIRINSSGKASNKWTPHAAKDNDDNGSVRHTMNPTAYALHTMGVELNGSCPNCEDVGSLTKDKKGSKFTCSECGITCEYGDIDVSGTADDLAILDVLLPRPRELMAMLDEHVIGQSQAKKVMSVAVYNHYKRVRRSMLYSDSSKHQLEVGPAVYKVGDKEYMNPAHLRKQDGTEHPVWSARQVDSTPQAQSTHTGDVHAHAHTHTDGIPLHTDDAPHNTDTDIRGEDATSTQEHKDGDAEGQSSAPKDASEGSGDGLTKKSLAERLSIECERRKNMPHLEKANVMMYGPTGTGKTLIAKTIAEALDVPFVVFDCTTLTQAGYAGEDVQSVIAGLLKNAEYNVSAAEQGIVFLDEVDKLCRKPDVRRDVSGEGVQHGLLKLLEGTKVDITEKRRGPAGGGAKEVTYTVDTANILFVGSGAFTELDEIVKRRVAPTTIGFGATTVDTTSLVKHVQQTDLIQCGLIPEFVGRFQVNVGLDILSKADLKRVMCEPKNAILEQYHALLRMDKTDLYVTASAMDEIAAECLKKKVNARGLRGILERVLLDAMFEAPDELVEAVVVDGAAVRGETQSAIVYRTVDRPPSDVAQEPVIAHSSSEPNKASERLVAEV
ncbi:hypothetical protein SARC_07467 [Sphaeroforma arctica JP610]|uniref:ATP-dependent Clp protease ATP-binding subunit ClpX n=1 Tax=Sphaeroforma arctica JP610 TaxID=667725 RepID=A0A0L0FTM6_9EUKA|nr:hypothetical protein SARC_07467 [Sphaeroforma arctica JP610]KNC80165.1 hypothetical protein SARC_07467 [Sphaeroforma arctica JP610]|eukprot:XP_014154067.1 hypothetical protein SARC_07467 [Sphaeroforma arctica JP610]